MQLWQFTEEEKVQLKEGKIIRIGIKSYALCRDCGKVIKVSGFFGGWHICAE